MFEYNSKIDYLFLKKSIEPSGVYRDELLIRDVYNNVCEPNDDFSFKLKSLREIIDYIKQDSTILNISSIKWIVNKYAIEEKYKMISNEQVLSSIINNYHFKEVDSNNTDFFIKLVESNTFTKELEPTIIPIIYNFLLIKHNHFPLIFKYNKTKTIINLIRMKEYLGVESYFTDMYIESNNYNTPHRDISLNEVKEIIISKKDYLISKLHIKSLYVYGSFAKGTNNKYSDIDIYITASNKTYNRFYYAAYMEDLLNLPVDVSVYYLDNLDGLNNNQKKHLVEVI